MLYLKKVLDRILIKNEAMEVIYDIPCASYTVADGRIIIYSNNEPFISLPENSTAIIYK